MRFSTIFTATAFAGAAMAENFNVVAGKDGLTFEPKSIKAAEGDTVTFKFWPKNHSIAQGTFANPCEPMDNGFWSGYVPTNSTTAAAATSFMYTVQNASVPVWFYCTQGKHCQGGMVGVINQAATGNRTIEVYTAAAANAANNVQPASKASDNPGFGMLMTNGTMEMEGAASTLSSHSVAFVGLVGLASYMFL